MLVEFSSTTYQSYRIILPSPSLTEVVFDSAEKHATLSNNVRISVGFVFNTGDLLPINILKTSGIILERGTKLSAPVVIDLGDIVTVYDYSARNKACDYITLDPRTSLALSDFRENGVKEKQNTIYLIYKNPSNVPNINALDQLVRDLQNADKGNCQVTGLATYYYKNAVTNEEVVVPWDYIDEVVSAVTANILQRFDNATYWRMEALRSYILACIDSTSDPLLAQIKTNLQQNILVTFNNQNYWDFNVIQQAFIENTNLTQLGYLKI